MIQHDIHKFHTEISVTSLINLAYYRLPKNYVWTGDVLDFWEMVYVDKGELMVTAGSDNYLLHTGELSFHCPNAYHNIRTYDQNPANIVVISFQCDSPMMKALERKILPLGQEEQHMLSLLIQEGKRSLVYFDHAAACVDLELREDAPFGTQQIIKNLLECLLILIRRRDNGIRFDHRTIPINQMHHHVKITVQVQDYINEHYSEKITLEQLAALQSISVSQLKRIFKEQTGTSIIAYLTDYRIGEAKRLIQESNLNFSQIAMAVGYDSIYYFSTVFKKQTGMTLTEYSKSLRR